MSTPSVEALRPPVAVKVPAEALLLLVVVAVGAPARRRPLEPPERRRRPVQFAARVRVHGRDPERVERPLRAWPMV